LLAGGIKKNTGRRAEKLDKSGSQLKVALTGRRKSDGFGWGWSSRKKVWRNKINKNYQGSKTGTLGARATTTQE